MPAHTMCANSLLRALRAATTWLGWVGGKPKSRSPAPIAATGSWKKCACPSAALSQHGHQARDEGHMPSTWICASEQRVVRPQQIPIEVPNPAAAHNCLHFPIFDWKPTLLSFDRIRKLQVRSSKYSVHPEDLLDRKISFKSDLKGMCLVLLQSKLGRAKGAKVAGKFAKKIDRLISKEQNPFMVTEAIKDLCNLNQWRQSEDIF